MGSINRSLKSIVTTGMLLMLLCLATAGVASAGNASEAAGDPVQLEQTATPPQLSVEVKRLIDGLLQIQQSDTLMFDQRGIEETLGVSFKRKPSKSYARYDITDLPIHMTGQYKLGSTFSSSLGAELAVYLDTRHACAHLPQVLEYIGKPYVRRLILFSAGDGSGGPKKPIWPGVRETVWATYHFGGDNPSEIKPHLTLTIQGIECVRIIEISAMLKRPEGKE